MKKLSLLLLSLCSFVIVSMAQPLVEFELIASGFDRPVEINHADDNRLFIVEQDGIIKILDSTYATLATPFINIDPRVRSIGNEQGLLGLAFHPDYANNGYFYVNYTDNNSDTKISRFSVDSLNPNIADANSELVLMTIPQTASNHNAGDLVFGPDGYLYFGMGDGGGAGDLSNNAQNKQLYLGKMIRIDVDGGNPYAIPTDNPYVNDSTVLDEIFAIGLRNPWRIAFDFVTGNLWIADVGQNAWEEVSIIPAGTPVPRNYGWRCYEGNHAYNTSGCGPMGSYVPAIYEYDHNVGISITGGFVYRGNDFPELYGHYVLADYGSGFVTTLFDNGAGGYNSTTQTNQLGSISTFGEDYQNELFAARLSGSIYKVKETCEELRPTIGLNGNTFVATFGTTPPGGTTYQWLFNGFPIPGATSTSYTTTASGTYSIEVSGTNSCVVESDTLTAVFTGIQEVTNSNAVSVFPNPFSNSTTIQFTQKGDYKVSVFDIEGRKVKSDLLIDQDQTLLEKGILIPGTYLLRISGDIEFYTLLLIN